MRSTRARPYFRTCQENFPTVLSYTQVCSKDGPCFTVYHYDGVIKWKKIPRYWLFVRGIHQPPGLPLTKASDAELWCFFGSEPEQTVKQTIETPVIWDIMAPIMTSLWCKAASISGLSRWNMGVRSTFSPGTKQLGIKVKLSAGSGTEIWFALIMLPNTIIWNQELLQVRKHLLFSTFRRVFLLRLLQLNYSSVRHNVYS